MRLRNRRATLRRIAARDGRTAGDQLRVGQDRELRLRDILARGLRPARQLELPLE